MKKNEVKKNNKGFSLVELIVVIAIMAVLVGVLAPQFIQYVNKSRAATDVQNTSQLKTAIETYCADYEGSATEFTIKKSTDKKKFEVTSTGDANAAGAALTNAGIPTEGVAIKYTKWKDTFAMTYTFKDTDGKWSWKYTDNTVTVGSTTYTAQ